VIVVRIAGVLLDENITSETKSVGLAMVNEPLVDIWTFG